MHLNGRVYDPALGRFTSADPFVPDADNLQSYNRFSYVMNRPMSFVDPSGYLPLRAGNALSDNKDNSCNGLPQCIFNGHGWLVIAFGSSNLGISQGPGEGAPIDRAAALQQPSVRPALIVLAAADAVADDALPKFGMVGDSGASRLIVNVEEKRPRDTSVAIALYLDSVCSPACVRRADQILRILPGYEFGTGLNNSVRRGKFAFTGSQLADLAMVAPVGGMAARGVGLIDTAVVRFTQDSVKGVFRNGTTLNDAAAALRAAGAEAASALPPIRLVEHEGQLFSLDNRRLLVFSQAGQQVPFRMATEAEIGREWAGKFTTTPAQGWGRFITVRP